MLIQTENIGQKIITGHLNRAWDLGALLTTPPENVERILHARPIDLVILTPKDLEQYVFDELFQRTKGGREMTPEYILSLKYIAENISNLYQSEKSDYVTDAIEDGNYKQAGDNAVFGYIHFVGKRRNPLSKEDYVKLAEQCYYRWYNKSKNSIGYVVASHVRGILEKIGDWNHDMMKRVPGFSVVHGTV